MIKTIETHIERGYMSYEKKVLFQLARNSILSRWNREEDITILPEYTKEAASFVTLRINSALRGCIGSLTAHQPLFGDIQQNAYNAAFGDPRFPPLTEAEYENMDINISLLTTPEIVKYKTVEELQTILRPNIDGVIFEVLGRRATFLPQVWEELSDFDLFFKHLSRKAGLDVDPFVFDPVISRYQVDLFSEK